MKKKMGRNEWRGGPEAGARGAGAVGVGGCALLRWPVAGLRCVSLARLRCARELWAADGLPPGSDLFPSGVGGGRAVAAAGGTRVQGAAVDTAWRPCVASRSRSLLYTSEKKGPTMNNVQ